MPVMNDGQLLGVLTLDNVGELVAATVALRKSPAGAAPG